MMDGIQQVRRQDIDDVNKLSSFAFQYKLTEEELAERRADVKLEEHWGYYIDGQLAAKLRIIPMKLYLHGHQFAMGGIASVASWPEYRRQGMIGQLLTFSLAEMKRLGQTISALHPFSFAFYRKYGWELNTEYKRYTVEVDQLPRFQQVEGFAKRLADPIKEWQVLHNIYSQYAQRYNGMIDRDQHWWEHRVCREYPMAIVYYNEAQEARGYLLYRVEQREMVIKEMLFIDEMARKALWNLISNHDSMIERVSLTAPVQDPLPMLLPEPRIKQEIIPYSMARVVDVTRFIEKFPFVPTGEDMRFVLEIEDQQAPWNDGGFVLEISPEGKARVDKLSAVNESMLTCDIQTFTAMMTGHQNPIDLFNQGRLKGNINTIHLWVHLIPRREAYLLDFF